VSLSEVTEVVEFILERIIEDIYAEVDYTGFSHVLLTFLIGKTLGCERVC
jgi:hypothetical protein